MQQLKVEVEPKSSKDARIDAHTHIKGLGLLEDGSAGDVGGGLVGQKAAREVCQKKTQKQNTSEICY